MRRRQAAAPPSSLPSWSPLLPGTSRLSSPFKNLPTSPSMGFPEASAPAPPFPTLASKSWPAPSATQMTAWPWRVSTLSMKAASPRRPSSANRTSGMRQTSTTPDAMAACMALMENRKGCGDEREVREKQCERGRGEWERASERAEGAHASNPLTPPPPPPKKTHRNPLCRPISLTSPTPRYADAASTLAACSARWASWTAVSKPKHRSTRRTSLSMLLGTPTTLHVTLRASHSAAMAAAAALPPLPPTTKHMSIASTARRRTIDGMSAPPRDVPRIVPPCSWMPSTSALVRGMGLRSLS